MPSVGLPLAGTFLLIGAFSSVCPSIYADGIDRNGIGARSMGMGGADVAWAEDPLGAMGTDPAALGFMKDAQVNLGAVGDILEGTFTKSPTSNGHLDSTLNGLPEAAFAIPLGSLPLTLGISEIPDTALDAHWRYVDPPGGLGGKTSYGLQTDKSVIVNLRSAIGVGAHLGDKFALGASFGADYNENELITPFVFQSQPKLKGAKVLLDLDTSGFGYNGQAALMYRPLTNLSFAASYLSPTRVYSQGDASGNAYAQFGVSSLPFSYHAQVRNIFPQTVEAGTSWGFLPQWRLALQLDWVNWGNAFQTLPVALSGGSSAAVNGVAGSSAIQDNIPLNWSDEFAYRLGLEYKLNDNWALRIGYCYSPSAVPDQTLTPMTAAIMEHTITFGVGYHWKHLQADLAYQYNIPNTQNVGKSGLLDGEYSNSSVEVDMHVLALTLGYTF